MTPEQLLDALRQGTSIAENVLEPYRQDPDQQEKFYRALLAQIPRKNTRSTKPLQLNRFEKWLIDCLLELGRDPEQFVLPKKPIFPTTSPSIGLMFLENSCPINSDPKEHGGYQVLLLWFSEDKGGKSSITVRKYDRKWRTVVPWTIAEAEIPLCSLSQGEESISITVKRYRREGATITTPGSCTLSKFTIPSSSLQGIQNDLRELKVASQANRKEILKRIEEPLFCITSVLEITHVDRSPTHYGAARLPKEFSLVSLARIKALQAVVKGPGPVTKSLLQNCFNTLEFHLALFKLVLEKAQRRINDGDVDKSRAPWDLFTQNYSIYNASYYTYTYKDPIDNLLQALVSIFRFVSSEFQLQFQQKLGSFQNQVKQLHKWREEVFLFKTRDISLVPGLQLVTPSPSGITQSSPVIREPVIWPSVRNKRLLTLQDQPPEPIESVQSSPIPLWLATGLLLCKRFPPLLSDEERKAAAVLLSMSAGGSVSQEESSTADVVPAKEPRR